MANEHNLNTGDLVIFNSEIHEIIAITNHNNEFIYKTLLKAFTRDMDSSEWHNQIVATPTNKTIAELSKFDQPKPKYSLGERVKLQDFDCVVRFIQYKHYAYYYSIMSIDSRGPTGGGWEKEESYLSK